MTRSVEIPDAAVKAATKAILDEGGEPGHSIHSWRCEYPDRYGDCDCVEVTARAALLAARPYLMPTREALEKLVGQAWDDGNAMGLDGYVGPNRGAGDVDPEAERGREQFIDRVLALLSSGESGE